ncbi:MAG: sigma-54-dependent Fis family transcriptional regulator [Gammaproteobacteria bacterium]|nr:MAG: sigma-54-dependent Fis family transcriptional regulator [Gammaproteobacteria bacterium]
MHDTAPLKILLVDDDPHITTLFKAILENDGFTVVTACDGAQALTVALEQQVACVITDLTMPRLDGFGLIEALSKELPDLPVIVVTGESHEDNIAQALSLNARNFLTKPISGDELRFAVHKTLDAESLTNESLSETEQVAEKAPSPVRQNKPKADNKVVPEFPDFIGKSPPIQRLKKMMAQVADTDSIAIILGESGVGKEVVARCLHYNSSRRKKLFVPVNCGAIPEELLESELFGHEKGAFTGAITDRKGRFELAQDGSLFLDEIGEMSLSMQVKLLRVLQEGTFERVGSNKTIHANVRVIAATHRNLEEEIENGRFREDLYYRLNVFPLDIPPLRERASDIPLIVQRYLSRHQRAGREIIQLTDSASAALQQHQWRGNVRELENLLQRLIILYPGAEVTELDLPPKYQTDAVAANHPLQTSDQLLPEQGMDLKQHLFGIEHELISQAMERSNHVVAHAAEHLGMRRTTLVEKLRKFNLDKKAADSHSQTG